MSELNAAASRIYSRLAGAPTFHPASANLFIDWNMQAGDVVNVKSDSDVYQVPIYNMNLKWTGAPKVTVESTGNPEREPLPAIKRREYSANSSNYTEQKSLRGSIAQTAEGIRSEIYAVDSKMGSIITQTAESIRSEIYAVDSKLYSVIT